MPADNAQHKVKRRYPVFPAQRKEAIRREVLDMLKADPSLYLSDLKDYLVTKYHVAKQTAYQWLREWSIT